MYKARSFVAILVVALFCFSAQSVPAQGKSNKNKSKQEQKKLDKEARKTEKTAEKADNQLGRNVVFCILAAHTTIEGYETAEALRAKFEDPETGVSFGQFVAAVILADRLDSEELTLDEILERLKNGDSIGKITQDAGVNMGDVRRGFGQFRSELARSITNPPTRNCFSAAP
jgi:hypothetical protein